MRPQPKTGRSEVKRGEEKFDPLSLDEGDDVIDELSKLGKPRALAPSPAVPAGESAEPAESDSLEVGSIEFVEVPGWRVQIAAVRNLESAKEIEEKAREDFGPQVYVQFESSWYKIRVGDCLTKSEAIKLMREVEAKGYKGAFPVRCVVFKPKE